MRDAPVSLLLARLHVELTDLADGVLAVQHAVSPVLAAIPSVSADTIRDAQRLDLIEQTLRDLAVVVSQAAREGGGLDLAALAKLCRLSAVAGRLRGDAPGSDADHSELDLF